MESIDDILGIQTSPQAEARRRSGAIPQVDNIKHTRRTSRHKMFPDSLRAKSAIETLNGLPAEGESWHMLMTGSYDSFDLVDGIMHHAREPIQELWLATLGFNAKNAARLTEMLQAGRVKRACMVISVYFEADPKEADTCYRLRQVLPTYGSLPGWYCAARSHAKLILARLMDGQCFVIESSANLRSCRCIEQFCITQDVALFNYHTAWMQEVKNATEQAKNRSSGD